jgi:toxin secretion/phage lysis holin
MIWDKIIKAVAVVAGAIAGLYGGWSAMLTTLVVMMAIDYVTGVLVAALGRSPKTEGGGLSSKVGFIGIAKKGIIMLIVLLATLLDQAIGNVTFVFQGMTVAYYIANEGLSILENADALNIPTPKFIHDRLERMRAEADDKPPDGKADTPPED